MNGGFAGFQFFVGLNKRSVAGDLSCRERQGFIPVDSCSCSSILIVIIEPQRAQGIIGVNYCFNKSISLCLCGEKYQLVTVSLVGLLVFRHRVKFTQLILN